MKRASHLLEKISDPDNLRLAFWKARKGKDHSRQVEEYRRRLDFHLNTLRKQLLTGEIEVGDYNYFKIYDPKKRQICAAAFREQVLHHGLMNICHQHFEKKQIFDSYASRPGKGTHAAVKRAKFYCRSRQWFLKLDVRKFFASIHHGQMKDQLQQLFKEYCLLDIFGKIIDSYEASPGRGMPIGNLTSQYFANHYLAGLDHFIKEKLRCKSYVRYMDDMVLWHRDKAWLKQAHQAISDYVSVKLHCRLKPELLNRTERGLPFLGYLIFPHTIRLSQRSKRRFILKLCHLEKMYQSGEWSEAVCQRRVLPLVAFTRFADAGEFRKNVLHSLTSLTGPAS